MIIQLHYIFNSSELISLSYDDGFFFSCQFVVRADGEYSVYLADPDALVDWEFVEQIVS